MSTDEDAPDWVTLGHEETVVWSDHPSLYLVKRWLVVAAVATVLGLVGATFLPPDWRLLGWLAVVAGVVVAAAAYVTTRTITYVVTTEKAYKKTGLLNKHQNTVRLERVQTVSLAQSLLQRPANCGDLTLDTAGNDVPEIVFDCVREPERVNGLIADATGAKSGTRATSV
ncbi:PH domain-containing protein [Halomicrococcus sp. SG-WS-1]|uniref:PH domain-containing protein n=1 Tax=Halomicrococcus sp. SG-WS-1 TaxID=3439057 RepID=UPI003F7B33CD